MLLASLKAIATVDTKYLAKMTKLLVCQAVYHWSNVLVHGSADLLWIYSAQCVRVAAVVPQCCGHDNDELNGIEL